MRIPAAPGDVHQSAKKRQDTLLAQLGKAAPAAPRGAAAHAPPGGPRLPPLLWPPFDTPLQLGSSGSPLSAAQKPCVRIAGVRMTRSGAAGCAAREPERVPWRKPPPVVVLPPTPASEKRRAHRLKLLTAAAAESGSSPAGQSSSTTPQKLALEPRSSPSPPSSPRRPKQDAVPTREAVIQQWAMLKAAQDAKDTKAGIVKGSEQEEEARLSRARERDMQRNIKEDHLAGRLRSSSMVLDSSSQQPSEQSEEEEERPMKWKVVSGTYIHDFPAPLSHVSGFLRVGEIVEELERLPPASPTVPSTAPTFGMVPTTEGAPTELEGSTRCSESVNRPKAWTEQWAPDWIRCKHGWVQPKDERIKGACFLEPYQSPRPRDINETMLQELDRIVVRLADTMERLQPDRFRPPLEGHSGQLQRSDSVDAILATGTVTDHDLRALMRTKLLLLRRAHARHAAIADALGTIPLSRQTLGSDSPSRKAILDSWQPHYEELAELMGSGQSSSASSTTQQQRKRPPYVAPPAVPEVDSGGSGSEDGDAGSTRKETPLRDTPQGDNRRESLVVG
eukprot:TRINITY_DN15403_c0_g1_i1.p1 TRINITY_DN15403_c0_g1~~TRINITY_DN15403_c0_g1_i1.p1  ORF type:complete len:562 (+),score=170.91 TRINITY_DN15403_c0_g1_i1:90-1775(+)